MKNTKRIIELVKRFRTQEIEEVCFDSSMIYEVIDELLFDESQELYLVWCSFSSRQVFNLINVFFQD